MSESPSIEELRATLTDEDVRYNYAESILNGVLATQIRVLREQRGLTQEQLGGAIGTTQSGISNYEHPAYARWSLTTLKRIARALDVRLSVRFESFGSLAAELRAFNRSDLQRPTFQDDPTFRAAATSTNKVLLWRSRTASPSRLEPAIDAEPVVTVEQVLRVSSTTTLDFDSVAS